MNAPYTFVSIAAPSAMSGTYVPVKAEAPKAEAKPIVEVTPLIRAIASYAKYAGKGIEKIKPIDDYAAYLARNLRRFMHDYHLKEPALLHICTQIWHKERPRGRYGRPVTAGGLRARIAHMARQARKAVIAKYAESPAK